MRKIDFSKLSKPRKIILTVAGVILALYLIANMFFYDAHITNVLSLLVVIVAVSFLWVK